MVEADHTTQWQDGRKTGEDNCEMLFKEHYKSKVAHMCDQEKLVTP